jgi:hypothetical protein
MSLEELRDSLEQWFNTNPVAGLDEYNARQPTWQNIRDRLNNNSGPLEARVLMARDYARIYVECDTETGVSDAAVLQCIRDRTNRLQAFQRPFSTLDGYAFLGRKHHMLPYTQRVAFYQELDDIRLRRLQLEEEIVKANQRASEETRKRIDVENERNLEAQQRTRLQDELAQLRASNPFSLERVKEMRKSAVTSSVALLLMILVLGGIIGGGIWMAKKRL